MSTTAPRRPVPDRPQALAERATDAATAPHAHARARAAVGAEVERLRLAAGLSRRSLARAAGLDEAHVRRLEHGTRPPSRVVLEQLAPVLAGDDVDPAALVEDLAALAGDTLVDARRDRREHRRTAATDRRREAERLAAPLTLAGYADADRLAAAGDVDALAALLATDEARDRIAACVESLTALRAAVVALYPPPTDDELADAIAAHERFAAAYLPRPIVLEQLLDDLDVPDVPAAGDVLEHAPPAAIDLDALVADALADLRALDVDHVLDDLDRLDVDGALAALGAR